jgi:hypothetical protein
MTRTKRSQVVLYILEETDKATLDDLRESLQKTTQRQVDKLRVKLAQAEPQLAQEVADLRIGVGVTSKNALTSALAKAQPSAAAAKPTTVSLGFLGTQALQEIYEKAVTRLPSRAQALTWLAEQFGGKEAVRAAAAGLARSAVDLAVSIATNFASTQIATAGLGGSENDVRTASTLLGGAKPGVDILIAAEARTFYETAARPVFQAFYDQYRTPEAAFRGLYGQ